MSEEKRWTADEIRSNLRKYDKWLVRGIVAIYQYQTEDEKASKETRWDNNVGFNGVDAEFLSDLAESALSWKKKHGELSLSPGQIEAARPMMLKYSQQLADIANDEVDQRRSRS